jgi:hypothetical protein
VVLAQEGDDRAVPRGAGEVAVLEGVAGTIDSGAFAVPQADDAVEARVG